MELVCVVARVPAQIGLRCESQPPVHVMDKLCLYFGLPLPDVSCRGRNGLRTGIKRPHQLGPLAGIKPIEATGDITGRAPPQIEQ